MRTVVVLALLGLVTGLWACATSGKGGETPVTGIDWSLVDSPGGAPTLLLADANKASGFAGVNRWFGPYERSGTSQGKLRFGNIGMTMMAGPDDAMKRETRFVAALQSIDSYRVIDGRLELLSKDEVLLTFTPTLK